MRIILATSVRHFIISALLILMLAGMMVFFVLVYQKKMIRKEIAILHMKTKHLSSLLNTTIVTQESNTVRLNSSIALGRYRVIREALNNCLKSIKSRVNILGGHLLHESAPMQGTSIKITLPLEGQLQPA
ncbi:MAG: hypothetical protein AAGM67_20065 [Bacteroidota bacterium]